MERLGHKGRVRQKCQQAIRSVWFAGYIQHRLFLIPKYNWGFADFFVLNCSFYYSCELSILMCLEFLQGAKIACTFVSAAN